MKHHLRTALEVVVYIVVVSLIWIAIPAPAHAIDHAQQPSGGLQASSGLNPSPRPAPTGR
jgi:hypothetical protein